MKSAEGKALVQDDLLDVRLDMHRALGNRKRKLVHRTEFVRSRVGRRVEVLKRRGLEDLGDEGGHSDGGCVIGVMYT